MIQFKVNQDDWHKIKYVLGKLESMSTLLKNDHPYECALEYKNLVYQNILGNRFGFAPLSKRYYKWKERKGYEVPGFWKLRRDLLTNLTAFQNKGKGGGYVGGIPGGIRGNKGRYVGFYGTMVEKGWFQKGKQNSARPMFENTKDEYEVSGFQQKGEKALFVKLRGCWG